MGSFWSQEAASTSSTSSRNESFSETVKALARVSRTHKMVLVANMALKMGKGKLAAQVGHATLAVYKNAMKTIEGQAAVKSWEDHGQIKVVLKGDDTEHLHELYKQAKQQGCWCYIVQDAGFTQIAPGSHTVLGIFGELDKVDSVTGKLKLLN